MNLNLDLDLFLAIGAVTLVVTVLLAFLWGWRGIRQEIVDALNKAESEEEKAEIERRVVKALFPPRFNR
jgi:hypothetical protein